MISIDNVGQNSDFTFRKDSSTESYNYKFIWRQFDYPIPRWFAALEPADTQQNSVFCVKLQSL